MRTRSKAAAVLAGILLAQIVPFCGAAIALSLGDVRLVHVPIHAVIEATGALMAMALAGILLAKQPRTPESEHYPWMACGFVGLGVLGLFHGATEPGNVFVWLHIAANFVGGVFFAGVWLGRLRRSRAWQRWLPGGVLLGAAVAGAASCLLETAVPHMLEGDRFAFSLTARVLNITGSAGFLLAAAFFVQRFHRDSRGEDWLFAVQMGLFGAAGAVFEFSTLWNGAWWWWHILRMIAQGGALAYAAILYLQAEREVRTLNRRLAETNQQLDRQVAERTAKLRASEERFALAVRGTSDGVWDWNVLTDEVYYAPRFKELLGFRDEELPNVFASFESRLHPEDRERTLQALRAHLERREPDIRGEPMGGTSTRISARCGSIDSGAAPPPYDVEYRLLTKANGYQWFRARGVAVWDESGQARRMAGAITDITAWKEALAALERGREAAEAANRAKSDFLANMSHEIRTPIHAIMGLTELVLDTELPAAQRESLALVLESAESLLAIVNQILDFSKIEAGKLHLEQTEFAVREVVGDAVKSLAVRAHVKGLELAHRIEPDVPEVLIGDPVRLRQLINNLVGNAIKFTERGAVLLRARCESLSADEAVLHFTVADTGIGIPADKQQLIFEAFTQADSSTTRRFGGTGLGLAITRKVVNLMSGRLWVESVEGCGSTFHFTARLARAPAATAASAPAEATGPPVLVADSRAARPVKPSAERNALAVAGAGRGSAALSARVNHDPLPASPLPPLHILVAEDGLTNRKLVVRLLEKWGHTVTAVENGREALAAVQSQSFDLVLMDVQMPEMDGREATAAIRQRENGTATHLPIIALTAHALPEDRERCLAAGMDGYLAKPIHSRELQQAIEQVFLA